MDVNRNVEVHQELTRRRTLLDLCGPELHPCVRQSVGLIRKFTLTGEIRPVEFCVEYDIHPDCRDRCGPLFPEDQLGHDCQYLLEQSRADPAVVVELGWL